MSAARTGALEILRSPVYGEYNSRIRMIAPETDSAETNKLVITVPLGRAKRPKLMRSGVSQESRMMKNGMDIDVDLCSYINHRVCLSPARMPIAWAWIARCLSSFAT